MPNILVKVPLGAYPGANRSELVRRINDAAAVVELKAITSQKRVLSWVVIEETDAGNWTCGGINMSSRVLPCFAMIHLPREVIEPSSQELYVRLLQKAFSESLPQEDSRQVALSVIVHDIADGTWDSEGSLWTRSGLAFYATWLSVPTQAAIESRSRATDRDAFELIERTKCRTSVGSSREPSQQTARGTIANID